nr:hypothetical protein [Pseudogemmobacter bohemicus]
MIRLPGEVAFIAFSNTRQRLIFSHTQGAGDLPPFVGTGKRGQVASSAETLQPCPDQCVQFRLRGPPGHCIAQALHKHFIHEPEGVTNIVPQFIIKGHSLVVVRKRNLIRCQRIAGRAGCTVRRNRLPFGLCNLVLKLRHRARQQFQGLPVVAAQRGAKFGFPDSLPKVFRDHESGEIAPIAVHEMPNFACHYSPVCNVSCNSEADKTLDMQVVFAISMGYMVGGEGLEPPTSSV